MNRSFINGLDAKILMKDSGVEWLGKIPKHWELVKLKYLAFKIDELDDSDVELRLAVENIQGFNGKLTDLESFNYEGNTKKFRINDIIFNKLRPYLGKVYFAEQEGGVYGELLVLRPVDTLVPKFLFYIMISIKFIDLVNSSTTGAKMPRASWEDFIRNIPIPVIPQNEQNKIVDYLDSEVTKIDALIDKKIQLIAILEEKKKALINQTVTRGLDPSVSLKDSGVEWLGDIPEHWEVVRLKYLGKGIETGGTPLGYDIPLNDDGNVYNWFTPGDFEEDFSIVKESKRKLSYEIVENNGIRLYDANSVMFVGIGATLGKVAITDFKFYTNQQLNIIELKDNVDKFFVAFSLSALISVLKMLANSATLPILNQQKLGEVQIPIPKLEEQNLIVNNLRNILNNHISIVSKISYSLELLKEKRKAIISAAINGELNSILS